MQQCAKEIKSEKYFMKSVLNFLTRKREFVLKRKQFYWIVKPWNGKKNSPNRKTKIVAKHYTLVQFVMLFFGWQVFSWLHSNVITDIYNVSEFFLIL